MGLIVKLMDESHIHQVIEVSRSSFTISWSEESFKKELSNPLAKYVVAILNGNVVGFAGIWVIVDEGHITNIATLNEHRGKGIGTELLKELLKVAESLNCIATTLEVRKSNTIAQKLYSSAGFVIEGIRKGYYEDNKEDAIIMWKR